MDSLIIAAAQALAAGDPIVLLPDNDGPMYKSVRKIVEHDRPGPDKQGLVLFFDADWRLYSWRSGLLRDLTREARRPPAFVDDEEGDEGA